jgi:23S rRNA (uracil1939-C5)-methyltransferase
LPRVAELSVEAIGQRGDGIATLDGRRIFVPLTAPGDRVRAEVDGERAKVLELLEASPRRVAAPCAHFGDCGGCTLQHVEMAWQLDWKRGLVRTALARAGVEAEVLPTQPIPPGRRRRATLAARRAGKRLLLGFNARRAHRIVPLTECWVLRPEIVALLPALRDFLTGLRTPAAFDVHVAWLDGLDVWIAADLPDDLAMREALAGFAQEADLSRLAIGARPEVAVQRRAPALHDGNRTVVPPPGGFLQASAEAEAWLQAQVEVAAKGARRVADLYAGCGALTLPLAGRCDLRLYEGDAAAVAAARAAGLNATQRDLARRPLQPDELANVDCVVLDPPRAGATPQAATLAASAVPTIAYVSCHANSFARDAKTLVDGGYRLAQIQPLDQFTWSAHVELAARFAR